MASKLQIITELSKGTAQSITDNHINWTSFLNTAAWNYKYKFEEQILIYAQKPNATACAPIEVWNNLGRWVKKGAKGIAIINDKDSVLKLRHIFDVSDTQNKYEPTFTIWQMQERFTDNITEALENQFGELEDKNGLHSALISAAHNAVEDNFGDYLSNLHYVVKDSMLEELDEFPLEVEFKKALRASVSYMMLVRCGISANEYFDHEDFWETLNFNTPETIAVLGTAASDIAELTLREIGETIKTIKKEERIISGTVAQKEHREYDKPTNKIERSSEYGTDLQNAGRLPITTAFTTSGDDHRQIWQPSQELSQNPPQRDLFRVDDYGQANEPSIRNRDDSQGETNTDDRAYDEGAGSDGSTQGDRPDEMGGNNEPYPHNGRRNDIKGAYLQLEILPSFEEQLKVIEEAEGKALNADKTSAFSVSQEDCDSVLQDGSGFQDGKYRIYEFFTNHNHSTEEISTFLKNEYGIGGGTHFYPDGIRGNQWHDAKGIGIEKYGSYTKPDILLSWSKVAKRIGELIALDRYLNPKEKEHYPKFLKEKDEQKQLFEEERITRDILSHSPAEKETDEIKPNYHLFLGATVYLGASEYELLSFDEDTVMLFDCDFPLLNKELSRYDFDKMLFENPLNSHLNDVNAGELNTVHIVSLQNITNANKEFVEEHSNDFGVDKFYVNYENRLVTWVYYNPDSNSGGQFVYNEFNFSLIDEAYQKFNEPSAFLGCIGEQCKQRIIDIDADDFKNAANEFLIKKPSFVGYDWFAMDNLVALVTGTLTTTIPVGRIDYLGTDGKVGESVEFDNVNSLISVIKEDNFNGVPMAIVLYKGNEIATDWIKDLDPLPQGICWEEYSKSKIEQEPLAQMEEPILPVWNKPKPKQKAQSFDLYPNIPFSQRYNFQITDNELGIGGPKEKFYKNIAAITLLKDLESQNRYATPEEQQILSQYVGWGGLSDAFDQSKDNWSSEYLQLKNLLEETEYNSARESTLSAFYTPPVVIKAIYDSISNMGFTQGNILEPSCGTGNFLGLLPNSMSTSKLYGIELDSISGRIAQQLYQKSSIAVSGFEKTNLPDSFFDVAIGNVPFGQFKVLDKRYDKLNFLIHDFFFAKALDKVRPGGVVAFITSKGTLDKENPAVRKYIAQRADLLGAIRLPNNTFKANAGTETTADIIFLQKRDRLIDIEPDWVHLGKDENGIAINSYFVENPDMIMGEMVLQSTQYGMDSTCKPYEDTDLEALLSEAMANIHCEIAEYEVIDLEENDDHSIAADPSVRNFSFAVVENMLYYRENSRMNPVEAPLTTTNRIREMVKIRDCVRTLIEYQTEDYDDESIRNEQIKLNSLYDSFLKKYGLINSRANNSAFSDDSSYPLLCSLEILDENAELLRKADMFSKRTIKQRSLVKSVDTASEALAITLSEKARVDMVFMSSLTGKTEDEIQNDLKGVVFLNPLYMGLQDNTEKYLTADEYLSGNVREKLRVAKKTAELYPEDYAVNVFALEAVQPIDLNASEISVRLGATWLPSEIVQEFMFELLSTPRYCQYNIKVHYLGITSQWNIEGKSFDRTNIKANNAYGTARMNAYKIIEETLNLKDVRIYDTKTDADGKKTQELNRKETTLAQAKQELIRTEFSDWIWKDPQRREKLCMLYNERFNSCRPREYDGRHLHFSGINPEISLRTHQINAIAHILYGGNTLLAHVVGGGKTFEMVAACMESKRIGLCQKSLFVVPNHLTEQWASEFLQLYPCANILVATKKDFETKNRKKFCGRIATGDYDAVIIGHTQFERIPMSIERQHSILQQQLDEIIGGIADLKHNRGENFSIKQLEKTKKSIQLKIEKLNDQSRKDDVVTFEELGVDRLFVDESHHYKNRVKRCNTTCA